MKLKKKNTEKIMFSVFDDMFSKINSKEKREINQDNILLVFQR